MAVCSEMHTFLSVRACGTYGYRRAVKVWG